MNFWTVGEQEMYKITRLFFWYQAEGAGRLDKRSRFLDNSYTYLSLLKGVVIVSRHEGDDIETYWRFTAIYIINLICPLKNAVKTNLRISN